MRGTIVAGRRAGVTAVDLAHPKVIVAEGLVVTIVISVEVAARHRAGATGNRWGLAARGTSAIHADHVFRSSQRLRERR
jgi:hypothetical protein